MADKKEFVKTLAKFLVEGQASKSIKLEMGEESAKEWSVLRQTTPIFGYPTVAEAEAQLSEWLEISLHDPIPFTRDGLCGKLSFAKKGRKCVLPWGHQGGHDFQPYGTLRCAWPTDPPCQNKPLKGLTMCKKHQPIPANGPSVKKTNGRKSLRQ